MDADASGEFRRRTNTNVLQDGNTCRHFLCLPRYTTWTCIVARLQFLAVGALECMHEKPHVCHISSRQTRGDATLGCCSTTLTHSQRGFPVHLTVAEKAHRKSIANLQQTFEISQNASVSGTPFLGFSNRPRGRALAHCERITRPHGHMRDENGADILHQP